MCMLIRQIRIRPIVFLAIIVIILDVLLVRMLFTEAVNVEDGSVLTIEASVKSMTVKTVAGEEVLAVTVDDISDVNLEARSVLCDFPWDREGDMLHSKYAYVTHSELNAILNFRGGSLEGSKLYVSLFPCNECAKAIIQSGIKTVIYDSDKYNGTPGNTAAKRMFDAAGVTYVKYEHTGRTLSIDV